VDGGKADTRDRVGAHDSSLKFSHFHERRIDAVLNRPNLDADFTGGIFNQLSAHDCSSPGASRAEAVAGPICGSASY
jgi:hypothetical protein